ncbi:MAG TPA: hypothetical protein VE173_10380 [Longimicrobiales bacterium]|nr:hypothetical protein [Longimicrobiales bacterium]
MIRSLSHVDIAFDRPDARFEPGEEIAGTVRVDGYAELDYRRIRLDLLWRTRGDGSMDQGERSSLDLDGEGHLDEGETREFRFSLEAPDEPFTWKGRHFAVEWVVEARVDVPGSDARAEQTFILEPGEGSRDAPYQSGGPFVVPDDPERHRQIRTSVSYGCGLVFGVPLLLMGVLFVAASLWSGDAAGVASVMGVAVGAVMIGLGGLFVFATVRRHWSERALREVDARLDPWSVRPGETVRFRLRLVPDVLMTVTGVHVRLDGEERAVLSRASRSGQSFRRSIHEEVCSLDAPAEPLAPGAAGEWEAAFHVPDEAPFTFRAHHNRVQWTVAATVEIAGRADWGTILELQVRP